MADIIMEADKQTLWCGLAVWKDRRVNVPDQVKRRSAVEVGRSEIIDEIQR